MCQANFLVMTMRAHLLSPSSVSMSTNMEIAFDCSFCIRLLLLGSQGSASSSEASPDSMDHWNQCTKLGPFLVSSFNHNFQPNNNQTFIVYPKSTLVLYRKGLCGFFQVLGFILEVKLCGKKCCKYYRPEEVINKISGERVEHMIVSLFVTMTCISPLKYCDIYLGEQNYTPSGP